jgi:hypothetical protein
LLLSPKWVTVLEFVEITLITDEDDDDDVFGTATVGWPNPIVVVEATDFWPPLL